MNSIQTRKAAKAMNSQMTSAPSIAFGMPACGHVSTGVIAGPDAVRVKGDMGWNATDLAVRTYAQGTHAWSPPPS